MGVGEVSQTADGPISAKELAGLLGSAADPFLLAVRQPEEVSNWSILEAAFVARVAKRLTERPPNHVKIIQAHMGRSSAPAGELALLEVGPNRCSA